MRVCTIHNCSYTRDRRCCADCDRISCQNRCLNSPDRCRCFSYEDKLLRGQKKNLVDGKRALALAQSGMEYKAIAAEMQISVASVTYHLNRQGYFRHKRGHWDG